MNALVSYDWLKEYVDLTGETPESFAARISLSGPAVEKIIPCDANLEHIVVGHTLSCEQHPEADKLKILQVDVGETKPLAIVCGGENVKVNQWVVVAKIGSRVKWHGEGELVELKPTKIRNVASEGMICGADEVGLADAFPKASEKEILDLADKFSTEELVPGQTVASLLGLAGDVVMDIEVTTNRPDAMGRVGMAREAASILKKPFLWTPAELSSHALSNEKKLRVDVRESSLCPRYMAVRLDGVKVAPSPWWIKRRLLGAGIRPINNIVDITNYILLELGQPMHVFDAEKLQGNEIVVRKAHAGEKFLALDGKDYELQPSMLVIADETRPVAIAGVMGGEETGVTNNTTSIVFEAAVFDAVSVRRTARALTLYSDSQSLFEKGLSTQAPPYALARAIELCQQLAGGEVSSSVVDVAQPYQAAAYSITLEEMNRLIGVELSEEEIVDTLQRLGFEMGLANGTLVARVPWWRDHDIESGRDLVEEVARVYGYANLPSVYPEGVSPRGTDQALIWEDRVRTLAKGAGLTEVYSYSFVSQDLYQKTGFAQVPHVGLLNPLNADFEFMRPYLLPSLIQVVADNQERYRSQALFELANTYLPQTPDLPREEMHLGTAHLGDEYAWKHAKGWVEYILQELGVSGVSFKRHPEDAFWHPGRSAEVWLEGKMIGTVGEIHPVLAQRFKLEGTLALSDLNMPLIWEYASTTKPYQPIPAYPESKRDLALVVDRSIPVERMLKTARAASTALSDMEWFDTYRGGNLSSDKKSVAFHFVFISTGKTLSTEEVDQEMEKIKHALQREVGAEVRT